MAYRAKTLRTMSPVTRKIARLIGEQESVARRLKNTIPELQQLELDSRALAKSQYPQPEPEDMPDILSYESAGIDKPEY